MPAAPIAKGAFHPHYYTQPVHPINKTNTTAIAKSGVIIMCAVLIAAGYTVYENRDQVRELVDRTRRKISLAMHTFAEEIMPSEQRQRHQPMAFSGRPDGSSHLRPSSRANSRTRSRRNSADSITLRGDDEKAEGSSRDAYLADSALRYRPPYRGLDESAASSNAMRSVFDDDETNKVLFDAAAEAAQQHILKSTSPGSDASSDTLSPPMSEKDFPLSYDAPPMIPAVLPTPVPTEKVVDQPPPLPPRPSHPQYPDFAAPPSAETTPTVQAETETETETPPPVPPRPADQRAASDPEDAHEDEELQTTFSTSQPYWAIQQWTEDVTGGTADEHNAGAAAESGSEIGVEDDHSAVQSLHSESETVSMIDPDEGRSEADDRVEFVSDMASSVGDTDGWSEVGSQFSESERM
ncbi:hypothetical protein Dda_7906 [Drechslerella dactyloides]|uniref:Uncharacterized protein n=1 Tax=Drechslerella dactyloides TaxID=74499 RepID=A0AAD6IRD6_DREDA|nr:hypothetical protein Dda_7906 [Drechslerella dactyloides]